MLTNANPIPYRPGAAPHQPPHATGILGPLELATAPSGLVVSVAEAKTHCEIEISSDDDYLEDFLIPAATRFCESEISGHRQFLTATYDVPAACWWEGPLRLPRPPLASVTSVKYYDSTGTLQTVSSSDYLVRTPWRGVGTVERGPFEAWPAYQGDRRFPVVVRFVAGYGAASAVPATIKQAILLLVRYWYDNRSAVITGAISKELEFAVKALLDSEGYGYYG